MLNTDSWIHQIYGRIRTQNSNVSKLKFETVWLHPKYIQLKTVMWQKKYIWIHSIITKELAKSTQKTEILQERFWSVYMTDPMRPQEWICEKVCLTWSCSAQTDKSHLLSLIYSLLAQGQKEQSFAVQASWCLHFLGELANTFIVNSVYGKSQVKSLMIHSGIIWWFIQESVWSNSRVWTLWLTQGSGYEHLFEKTFNSNLFV